MAVGIKSDHGGGEEHSTGGPCERRPLRCRLICGTAYAVLTDGGQDMAGVVRTRLALRNK